jgi:hypothetical protein
MQFRPMTVAVAAVLTAGAVGLGALGSDGWIATGYPGRHTAEVWGKGAIKPIAADEAYWLKSGRADITPVAVHVPGKLSFGPLDVLSVGPVPASLGVTADALQPMVLVTARETTAQGTRLIRFIVEAGNAPVAPAAKGL